MPGSSDAGSSSSSTTFAYLPSGSPQLPFAFTPSPHSLPTLAGQVSPCSLMFPGPQPVILPLCLMPMETSFPICDHMHESIAGPCKHTSIFPLREHLIMSCLQSCTSGIWPAASLNLWHCQGVIPVHICRVACAHHTCHRHPPYQGATSVLWQSYVGHHGVARLAPAAMMAAAAPQLLALRSQHTRNTMQSIFCLDTLHIRLCEAPLLHSQYLHQSGVKFALLCTCALCL